MCHYIYHKIDSFLLINLISVFVDTDGTKCVIVSFSFGADTIEREYEIRALQYAKSNELGGPPGCLQFFIATTAAVISFNWRANADGSLLTPASTDTLSKRLIYPICTSIFSV